MKAKSIHNIVPSNHIVRVALVTVFVLLIPLVAMQFTSEVNWSVMDFLVAGLLLFGTGLAYVLLAKRVRNKTHRIAVGVAIALAFAYIWAELAVGVFTDLGS